MRAGDLRHRVVIQSNTEAQNSTYGSVSNAFATLATVWARVETINTAEKHDENQVLNITKTKITIRYLSTVSKEQRVIHGSKTYEIEGITNPDQRNKFLELDCRLVE